MSWYKLIDDDFIRWGFEEASSPEEAELKFKHKVSLTLRDKPRKKMAASRLSKGNFTVEEANAQAIATMHLSRAQREDLSFSVFSVDTPMGDVP